ncbi:ribosomal RNA small subunit methyltransferase A [Candidatus Berkelbacteria bacterium]|nr:ribosomal RNA small subunit methyltransferase A [Candidatus Berkelbacteria bacterium]
MKTQKGRPKPNLRRGVAKKSLGQHFLVDPVMVNTLVKTAQLAPSARVLEIGPGKGIITKDLADAVPEGLVLAVEKDRQLAEALRAIFSNKKNVKVVIKDILELPISDLLDEPYQIVANLPFNITSPVITKFLLGDYRGRSGSSSPLPQQMTLIVQKEMAERLVAKPGNRERGILTVLLELFGQIEYIATIEPEAFFPAPEVKSAIVDIKLTKPQVDPLALLTLLKAGFANKRRQLHNSLAGSLRLSSNQAKDLLIAAGVNPQLRAEDLTLKNWLDLLKVVKERGGQNV